MNCTDIDNHIDDILDEQLNQQDQLKLQTHLSKCDQCTNKLKQAKRLHVSLQTLDVPEPSENFESRVFSQVRRHHKVRLHNRFGLGFATAMAASLMVWFVAGVFIPATQLTQPEVVAIAVNETQTVRLMFESTKAIQQVTLSIDLPGNIELAGYSGHKQLTWKTDLKQGSNMLALPVMAIEHGEGELIAQLKYGEVMKTFRLVLKTTTDGVQFYQLDQVRSV